MVFKRRDRRSIIKAVADAIYPKGGWTRAFHYVRHRVRRLPGSPERIARGILVGVFTTFTPFYGLHFFIAAILARITQGNILAALLSTFFGNPLTYLPIGVVSLKSGHFLLGTEFVHGDEHSLIRKFANAAGDLWYNFQAMFTDAKTDWTGLSVFYEEVFFPYMIGGIIPGLIIGLVAYYLSVPVIRAYQKRRAGKLAAKLLALKNKAVKKQTPRPGE